MNQQRRDCQCPRANHKHGTVAAYNTDRCRCDDCSAARARHVKRWRHTYDRRQRAGQPVGLIPAAGTSRRLQALAAIGWSTVRLGAELGVTQQRISELQLAKQHARVQATLAVRVAALYDRLWNITPTWPGASRARAAAAARGWVVPMAWDDDLIDEPDARPDTGAASSSWDLKPCGTAAAARRHRRRGEPLCPACVGAEQRQKRDSRARGTAA